MADHVVERARREVHLVEASSREGHVRDSRRGGDPARLVDLGAPRRRPRRASRPAGPRPWEASCRRDRIRAPGCARSRRAGPAIGPGARRPRSGPGGSRRTRDRYTAARRKGLVSSALAPSARRTLRAPSLAGESARAIVPPQWTTLLEAPSSAPLAAARRGPSVGRRALPRRRLPRGARRRAGGEQRMRSAVARFAL